MWGQTLQMVVRPLSEHLRHGATGMLKQDGAMLASGVVKHERWLACIDSTCGSLEAQKKQISG